MAFALRTAACLLFMLALALTAHALHVPARWIGLAAVILIGFGALAVTGRTSP